MFRIADAERYRLTRQGWRYILRHDCGDDRGQALAVLSQRVLLQTMTLNEATAKFEETAAMPVDAEVLAQHARLARPEYLRGVLAGARMAGLIELLE